MKRAALLLVGATALTACSAKSNNPLLTQFHREAGAIVDSGDFGNSTLNNTQVMTGAQRFTLDLAHRFAGEVPSTVNFAFNSAKLDGEARQILAQQANWIKQFPEVRFRVFGHTDAVGSDNFNQGLGLRRANAVVNYLVRQGISRTRLEAVISEGETMPLIPTEGKERQNRRTVTEVSGLVDGNQQVLDGKYARILYRAYVGSASASSTIDGTTVGGG